MAKRSTKVPGVKALGGGRYEVRATYVDPRTSKRRNVVREIEATSVHDAARKRLEIRAAEIAKVTPIEHRRLRLADAATSWAAKKKAKLKPSTRATYSQHLDKWCDVLGDHWLDKITPEAVEGELSKWLEVVGVDTVNGRLRVLRTMVREMKAPWIVEGVKARTKEVDDVETNEDEGRGLDELELRALVAEGQSQFARWAMAAEKKNEAPHRHVAAWWPLVATMLFTGLRFGEASALRWDDIDRGAGTIAIRRAHWHGIIGHPKSKLSRRRVVIPEPLGGILDEHRARLVRWQLPGLESGLAFPSPMCGVTLTRRTKKDEPPRTWTIGPIASKSGPRGAMEKLLANARVELDGRPTLHCLRHSLNNLLRQHASELVRQSLMGHDEAQNRRYSSVGIDEKKAAMGAVVARIGLAP